MGLKDVPRRQWRVVVAVAVVAVLAMLAGAALVLSVLVQGP